MDTEIEKSKGSTIAGIFKTEGEKSFREQEHNFLKQLLEGDDAVISTGGGVPCFYGNMELMNRNGLTIYLKMSPKSLADRLSVSGKERPLLEGKTGKALEEHIRILLEDRESWYLMAQLKVKGIDLDTEELAKMIKQGNV
jgi:shikimate kinase